MQCDAFLVLTISYDELLSVWENARIACNWM